jgi:hypothetical protein
MIKIERINVMNIDNAIHGMRNPMNSWHKSDSIFGAFNEEDVFEKAFDVAASYIHSDLDEEHDKWNNWMLDNGTNLTLLYGEHCQVCSFIGKNDLELAQKMINAGAPNDKFMRQIFVSMDITAPLYW